MSGPELSARIEDAKFAWGYAFSISQDEADPDKAHSPWVKYLATFLNKELGPVSAPFFVGLLL
jgi:hypothetical protein